MSDDLEKALAQLQAKLGDKRPDYSVCFDMGEDGALRIDEDGARQDDGSEADCTLRADMDVFREMFEGERNPTTAFMTGALKVDGDMGVAMKLASLFA